MNVCEHVCGCVLWVCACECVSVCVKVVANGCVWMFKNVYVNLCVIVLMCVCFVNVCECVSSCL